MPNNALILTQHRLECYNKNEISVVQARFRKGQGTRDIYKDVPW